MNDGHDCPSDDFRDLRVHRQLFESVGGKLEDYSIEASAGATVVVACGLDEAVRQMEAWGLLRGRTA